MKVVKKDSKFIIEANEQEMHYIERAIDILRQSQLRHVGELLSVRQMLNERLNKEGSELDEVISIQYKYLAEIGMLAEEISAVLRGD